MMSLKHFYKMDKLVKICYQFEKLVNVCLQKNDLFFYFVF